MSNFLSRLFGAKKKTTKAISRRLELLGLEDRIVPATISVLNNQVVIQLVDNEDISDLNTSVNGAQITINTVNSQNNTGGGTGLTVNNNSIVVNTGTGGLTGFAGISVLGFDDTVNFNSVTVGAAGIDLSNAPGGADQSVSINLTQGSNDVDELNVNGAIKSKGTGGVTLNASAGTSSMTIAAAGDITSTGGAVNISSVNLTSSGDITTGSGNISFGSALNLGGNIAINSTSGNLSMGIVTAGGKNLTINQGSGTVAMTNVVNITTGNLSITTTNATTNAIQLQNTVTAGDISLIAAGDISAANTVSSASVNAKSTAGDVIFDNTVTTTQVGGFTSEATSSAKATKIANLVDVQNGANALVTGNLVTNSASAAAIAVTGTATLNITGKVDAATANNNLVLTAANGAITIGGAVGSSTTAMGILRANGNTSFTANGAVTAKSLLIGDTAAFATSINFAEAVKVTGVSGFGANYSADINTTGTGTINFAKTLEATTGAGPISFQTQNGNATVSGNITSKEGVEITSSGSGNISVAGITTDNATGSIKLETGTGNITTSGVISTAGATANIDIDTITSGDIVIGGNVSTSGGGNILLGADTTSTAFGTGNLTINGTVSTTGTTASGNISIGTGGTGTVTVNKALSTGAATSPGDINLIARGAQINNLNVSKDVTITSADIVNFRTTGSTNTISLASGANVNAENGVTDFTNGNLNLASNITTTNGGVMLSSLSINLTGASSIKTGGTNNDIDLGVVNGAQNLTLDCTGNLFLRTVGQITPLNTVTINNSNGASITLNAANLVVADSNNNIGLIDSVISKSLTTAAKAYSVGFNGTSVVAGAPVFLNTGLVSFSGTASLPSGATITGNATSTVTLAGTIVSGGAFNIGAPGNTGLVTINNGTQLILNSSSAISTFAKPVDINSGGAGSLSLSGVGTLVLSGDSSTSSGSNDSISVTNGTLNVTGKFNGAANIVSGTISGPGGTIGNLSSTIGNVTPGGKLTTGAITLGAATNYNVSITGSTTASSLETAAAISLGSAVLNLTSVASGLKAGNQLTIINNTVAGSGNAISGTFAGLAEGATVSAKDASGNTVNFRISYKGTDGSTGNDAVLTVTSVTPSQSAPAQPMVAGEPALNKFTAFGADAGGGPLVTITFANGTYTSFFAYASTFTGGVRVALGDVNADGTPEVITGAGPGGGPQVNVFNVNPLSGAVSLQSSFYAFSAPNFTGGVYVAAGRTNSDGFDDVIVGAGATGGSRVQVYAGSANGVVSSSTLNDFFAYGPAFTGGVVVAAGNRDGDVNGIEEVITAPASNGGYNIKSFDCNGTGNSPTVVDNFFAFNDSTSVGGLSLAVGLFDAGNVADIVVGTTNNGYGVILNNVYSGIVTAPFSDFTGALRAGVAEGADGKDYAGVVAGPGGGPRLTVYSVGASSLTLTDNLFVMNPAFRGGLFMTPTIAETVI